MVCLRFCQHSDVTFLKVSAVFEFALYPASTCLSLYTLGKRATRCELVKIVSSARVCDTYSMLNLLFTT